MSEQTRADRAPEPSLRAFFVLWTGQAFSLFGSQLVQFALVWWLTLQTGSATVLAIASMVGLLPQVLLGPVAGALVDRWNRRRVMMAADAGIALATLLLAALYALGLVQVWHIYVLMLVRGIGGAFHWPAMQASTTLMVPERHLSRVAGLNQALWGASNIIAPPLGALLVGLLPMAGVLAIDVTTASIAVGALAFIQVPQPVRQGPAEGAGADSVLADLRAGLRLVWRWAGLRWILAMAMVVNLLIVPAMSLTPLLVTDTFGGGAMQLASLQSAMGVGMVAGGLILGAWGGFRRRIYTTMGGLSLMGMGALAVGLAPADRFSVALGGMLASGVMMPIVNGSVFALLQSTVPADMQGRVFTLMTSGSSLMAPLGLAVAGPLGDALGVQLWYVVAGAAMVLMSLGALAVPDIVHIEAHGAAHAAALRREGAPGQMEPAAVE